MSSLLLHQVPIEVFTDTFDHQAHVEGLELGLLVNSDTFAARLGHKDDVGSEVAYENCHFDHEPFVRVASPFELQ